MRVSSKLLYLTVQFQIQADLWFFPNFSCCFYFLSKGHLSFQLMILRKLNAKLKHRFTIHQHEHLRYCIFKKLNDRQTKFLLNEWGLNTKKNEKINRSRKNKIKGETSSVVKIKSFFYLFEDKMIKERKEWMWQKVEYRNSLK